MHLNNLANAVMCQDEDDLRKYMDWAGPDNGSRQRLLNKLQVCHSLCGHVAWMHLPCTIQPCMLLLPLLSSVVEL